MQHNNDIISGKISSDIENVEWNVGITTGQLPNIRFGSSSSQTSQNSGDICRICHCESDPQNPLLTPCYCSGSLKYVHQTCLQQWLTASETNSCELCKFPFIMHTKIKPFNEWRSLDMSGVERRRLFCAVLFHVAAALCVIWSLCVLIERAADEVKDGSIGWPFWTKLVVVTVGLTGGVVFMYIQCRQYLHLCLRWRARNRILLIQNAPEKIQPISPPSPILTVRHHNLPQMNQSITIANASNFASNYNTGRALTQSQCVANIENNPLHYTDRDMDSVQKFFDDSSQSSFKPCQRGSGSMTPLPFHDSAHTMYETASQIKSVNSSSMDNQLSNSTQMVVPSTTPHTNAAAAAATISSSHEMANEYGNIFKMPSNVVYQWNQNSHSYYPTSSIFLENIDILDDKDYPKLYHRHSTIMMGGGDSMSDNCTYDMKFRRYSDTKLLHGGNGADDDADAADDDNDDDHQTDRYMNENNFDHRPIPIFNVASVLGASIPNASNEMHAENYPVPQITDIIFENSTSVGTYDPLELNIQEMLELDMATNRTTITTAGAAAAAAAAAAAVMRKSRHSLNNFTDTDDKLLCPYYSVAVPLHTKINSVNTYVYNSIDNRNLFTSMPNLSASSENLLQK